MHNWQKYIDMQKKSTKSNIYIMLFMTGMFLLISGLDFYQIKNWDRKIRTYDHVEGVLTKHARVKRGSGRSRRTVSEISYRFKYKNNIYTGNNIAYNEDDFPHKIGSTVNIIVNPDDPSDSAAMVYYGSIFSKYGTVLFTAAIAAVMLIIIICKLFTREMKFPQKFVDYVESFPPEKYKLLCQKNIKVIEAPKFTLSGSVKYKYRHYAEVTNSIGKIAETIFFILIIMNLTGAIITSQIIILIPAAVLLFIVIIQRPKKVIFDIADKRFCVVRSPRFGREKIYHDFSDIECLAIYPMVHNKGGLYFTLFAVKKDDSAIYITRVPSSHFNRLCNVSLEVAAILDNAPIVMMGKTA